MLSGPTAPGTRGGGGGGTPAPSGGLTWIKLLLTDFSDARDARPTLSGPATQDAAGLITWPCNAPSRVHFGKHCMQQAIARISVQFYYPSQLKTTLVGLPDASTLINGTNVIHVRMTCVGEKNVGVMAAFLDRPATNQASTYGMGVGCYRNTSATNPKLIGAAVYEASAQTGGGSILTRSPYCTGVLQHPTVGGVNHYGGHVSIWEFDDPAYVREGGISYTRETSFPLDLLYFGIAAWTRAGGSGIAGNMTSTIWVAVQSSADWSQAPT